MISKDTPKKHIDQFPEEEISIDELIDRLYFVEKLEKRIAISRAEGPTISDEEIKEALEKWSK